MGSLHGSFDDFGYVDPVIINEENGELIKGHGRIKTAMQRKAAGDPPPKRVIVRDGEWLLPVIRGISMPVEQGRKYAVMDNRSSELGGWDDAKLGEVLARWAAEDDVESSGFDRDEVDQILGALKPTDYSDFEQEMRDKEGLEEVRIHLVVPKKHADDVRAWLAYGEELTGPGMGKGVLRRCGLI